MSSRPMAKATPSVDRPNDDTPFVRMTTVQRAIIVLVCFAYYCVISAIAFRDPAPGHWLILTSLAGLLLIKLLPILFYREAWGWFHPLVFDAVFVFPLLFKGFGMYTQGLDWHTALPDFGTRQLNELVAYETVLTGFATLAYYGGFASFQRTSAPQLRRVHPRQLKWIVFACAAFSTLVFVVYTSSQGGVLSYLSSIGRSRHAALAGDYYAIRVTAPGPIALLVWLAFDRTAHRRPVFWALALAMLAMQFVLTASRSTVIYWLAIGLLIYMMRERRMAFGRLLVAGLVAVYLVGVLGEVRRSTWRGEADLTHLWQTPLSEGLDIGRTEIVHRSTSSDGALAVLARVPEEVGLIYGSSYVALLTLPIPRSLWPDKPGLVGGRVGQTFFGTTGGVPPGAIGEAYWNFHIPGVLVVFFLFGWFHRWLARFVERNPNNPTVLVVYAMLLFLLRSPSTPALANSLWQMVAVVFILLLVRGFRHPARPPAIGTR